MENNKISETKNRRTGRARDFFGALVSAIGLIASLITIYTFFSGKSILDEETMFKIAPYSSQLAFGCLMTCLSAMVALFTGQPKLSGLLFGLLLMMVSGSYLVSVASKKLEKVFVSPECNRILSLAYAVGADSDGEYRFSVSGRNGILSVNFHCEPETIA